MRRISYRRRIRKPVVLRAKVRQRTLNRVVKTVKVFLIFVIILVSVFFVCKTVRRFLYSDIFEIKQIEAEGLRSISEEKFLNALSDVGLKVGGNIVETYFIEVEKKIKLSLPEIKSVKVKRYFPNRIKFIVTEREPIATVEVACEGVMAIDEENVCFVTDRDLSYLPEIVISTTTVNFVKSKLSETTADAFSERCGRRPGCLTSNGVKLLKAIKVRDKKLYLSILKVYNIKNELTLLLKNNTKIFFGEYNSGFIDSQLKFLNKVLLDAENRFGSGEVGGNIDYIDLKLFNDGRIIVKPVATT